MIVNLKNNKAIYLLGIGRIIIIGKNNNMNFNKIISAIIKCKLKIKITY